jgi:hypothetical protein
MYAFLTHAIELYELIWLAALAKLIIDANEFYWYSMVASHTFGHGRSHAAIDLVFFNRHQSSGVMCQADDRILIEGFDG